MKLPRLPRKCSVLEAKYSAEQMHEYGELCVKEYMKQIPTLIQIPPPPKASLLDQVRNALL